MLCKLCLKEKQLIKKSHIIPDFMYNILYDENHKLNKFSPKEWMGGVKKKQQPSSGEYEGGLLCKDCDNGIIGQYETYASSFFENEFSLNEVYRTPHHDGLFSTCRNVDYKKIKLFLLSILFRASISSRELFQNVYLGPHEEKIRKMIYDGNPGETSDYPIVFYTFLNNSEMPSDIITTPSIIKKDGTTFYIFLISGIFYSFYISKHNVPAFVIPNTIKKSNEFNIFHLPKTELGILSLLLLVLSYVDNFYFLSFTVIAIAPPNTPTTDVAKP